VAVPRDAWGRSARTRFDTVTVRDGHGLLCRNRRLIGTEQRLCGGCHGQNLPRAQGAERALGPSAVLSAAGADANQDRSRGWATVPMALRQLVRARFDVVLLETRHVKAAPPSHAGQNAPQERPQHCLDGAHGLVQPGPSQDPGGVEDQRPSDISQIGLVTQAVAAILPPGWSGSTLRFQVRLQHPPRIIAASATQPFSGRALRN
jgi:hypothetical protein